MDRVVLYDGICNLCNGTVNFLIKNDRRKIFSYAPLQSEKGKALMKKYGLPDDKFDTIIFLRGEKHYELSTAVLKIFKELGGYWKLMYAFIIIPPLIRDFIYRMIARTRYSIFGKTDQCLKT